MSFGGRDSKLLKRKVSSVHFSPIVKLKYSLFDLIIISESCSAVGSEVSSVSK